MSKKRNIKVGEPAPKDHPVYKDEGVATTTPVKKPKKGKHYTENEDKNSQKND